MKYSKYKYKPNSEINSNNIYKSKSMISGVYSNNKTYKKTNADNSKTNLIKSGRDQKPQNNKNVITTHIKIDLSKYINNSQKSTIDNIRQKKTLDNPLNINPNKSTITESRSRYINRSARRTIEKNEKIIYKKVYIELNKDKTDKIGQNNYSSNKNLYNANRKYQINNTDQNKNLQINTGNKNNFFVESKNLDNKTTSNNLNTYSNKNKNIIFNNRLKDPKVSSDKNKKNENEKILNQNLNSGTELSRIENIYLNIHNNNVIKNNNNILIKPNDINYNTNIERNVELKEESEKKTQQTNNNFINLNITNIRKEEDISDDDIQDNFFYDKNSTKENEIIYANINKDYIKKYINDNSKIANNDFPEDTDVKSNINNNININYIDYIKEEEIKTNQKEIINNNNTNNNDTNINNDTNNNDIVNKSINKNEIKNKETINKENQNQKEIEKEKLNKEYFNLEIKNNRNTKRYELLNSLNTSHTNSSMNNTKKFREYNNFYGNNTNKDINNESINLKNGKDFKNLIPKNVFQKFLTTKIKYYMKDDSIPKKFISDYITKKSHKKIISEVKKSKPKDTPIDFDFNSFNAYYEDNNIIREIKRSKTKKKKKIENLNLILIDENKALLNKLNQMKEYIDNSKTEMEQRDFKIQTYLQTYDRIHTENEQNKKIIENLEHALTAKNYEVEEKKNEIDELNNINYNLEKEMRKLKEEYINEAFDNRETKDNYAMIKNNYNDIKNQYDLLNIKYKTLSDENYNFKRDKMLYEKELKSKNILIDDLIQSNNPRKKEMKGQLNKLELNNIEEKEIKKYISSNKKERKEKEKEREEILIKENEEIKEKNKQQKYFEQLNIDELMNIRDELIGERNRINNEFYKIPTKANSKQNQRKNELENRLAQINNELAKIRIRINILKDAKKTKKI